MVDTVTLASLGYVFDNGDVLLSGESVTGTDDAKQIALGGGTATEGVGGSASLTGGPNDNNNGAYVKVYGGGAGGGALDLYGGSGFGAPGGDVNIVPGTGSTRGRVTLQGLPTVDPAYAGQLWNNLGILTISAG